MVLPEAPYPDVYTDTFIFFLRSSCKIIWMNVHYFPNAPRIFYFSMENHCELKSAEVRKEYLLVSNQNSKGYVKFTKPEFLREYVSINI